MGHSDSASSDDNYVPINPGSDIPMSPMPYHFDPQGYSSTALPIHRGSSAGNKIQPPPVNHHLKPGKKAKPTPLDLRNNTVISGLPFKPPVTKPWSSQYCHSISTQSITNTDSGDSEENYVYLQNPS
ncbi:GRB2-associated-binding protein 2 [Cricetulus griseus]|uniref:GRB2-associated-binding protein 2 n=1 Tax=Cricetulus griseus TaxID=10029 RepID=G3IDB2_CRIGR|nr:GRB2-associated-binding protein 2 [Cricetulus griseus]